MLARLLCPGYCTPCHLPACLFAGQATLPRLLHTLPPACLFAGQATLPRLLHTLPACLPVCWPGYSAQATAHPATCLPACLLARLLCPGYCTPCHLPVCLATLATATLPPACLVCWPGYSAQATAHPASCLPACLLARLLCPGYCTPCHLPACLFAGQATLPRLLHTLPPACLPVCWPGYSAQATAHPATCLPAFCWPGYSAQATAHPATCLPACLLARLLCPGYCTPCHLPALFAGQATLPRLLTPCHLPAYSAQATATLPACLPVCWPGYSAQATAHPATCLPACLLARLLCPGY